MIDHLFQVGALWHHRRLGWTIRIHAVVEPGKFAIALAPSPQNGQENTWLRMALSGVWSAEDLLRDYTPVLGPKSRSEHLLENLEEDL